MKAITDHLAAQERVARAAPAHRRGVLLAGARGRLGEAVLNALLASPLYDRVWVAAGRVIDSTERKLRLWTPETPLDAIDDVVLLPGESRTYYGRDDVYATLAPEDVVNVAEAARRAGAERALLLAPLRAFIDPLALREVLSGETEWALHAAGFPTLIVLRPGQEGETGRGEGGLGRRLLAWYLKQFAYLAPKSTLPLDSPRLARAALEALDRLPAGTHVLDAAQIQRRLLGAPAQVDKASQTA